MAHSQDSFIDPAFMRPRKPLAATSNERMVLDIVRRGGVITRAEIARRTTLTAMSISRLVDGLVQRGLLQDSGRLAGNRGQNIGVEVVAKATFSVGIAIMADTLSVALMDFSGLIVDQASMPLRNPDQASVLKETTAMLDTLLKTNALETSKLFGIGVSLSGYFLAGGRAVNAPRFLKDWTLVDVEALLNARFNLPVWLENDGNAAAIGESLFGVGRWAPSFAYLYIATGFGGGLIQHGEQLRGTHGNAGEFTGMLPPGFERPTLELLRTMVHEQGVPVDTVAEMLDCFDMTWPSVDRWIDRVKGSFSLIASATAAILDPDAIVLGGRIPTVLAERLIPHIEIYRSAANPRPRPQPRIVAAEAHGEPTASGAAALPFKRHFYR